MPVELVDFLNKFGIFGGGILLFWAFSTGRAYFKREVDNLKDGHAKEIEILKDQLRRAQAELDSQRGLMSKVVDASLKDRNIP
jgi:hypothetical protein